MIATPRSIRQPVIFTTAERSLRRTPQNPPLTARWTTENGRLVCRWTTGR